MSALYLAANGCDVTTLTPESEALERVMQAAIGAGLAGRVHVQIGDLSSWTPEDSLSAVIVNPSALDAMSSTERGRVIQLLQGATARRRGSPRADDPGRPEVDGAVSLEELRSQYRGWTVTVERSDGRGKSFLARKGAA